MLPRGTHEFPKRHRLNRAAEFQRVLHSARFRRNRGPLRILAVANTMPTARLGLIVGKRALRHAYRRNAVKRVVREVFRTSRSKLPAADVVVQLRGSIGRDELRRGLEEGFKAMAQSMDKKEAG